MTKRDSADASQQHGLHKESNIIQLPSTTIRALIWLLSLVSVLIVSLQAFSGNFVLFQGLFRDRSNALKLNAAYISSKHADQRKPGLRSSEQRGRNLMKLAEYIDPKSVVIKDTDKIQEIPPGQSFSQGVIDTISSEEIAYDPQISKQHTSPQQVALSNPVDNQNMEMHQGTQEIGQQPFVPPVTAEVTEAELESANNDVSNFQQWQQIGQSEQQQLSTQQNNGELSGDSLESTEHYASKNTNHLYTEPNQDQPLVAENSEQSQGLHSNLSLPPHQPMQIQQQMSAQESNEKLVGMPASVKTTNVDYSDSASKLGETSQWEQLQQMQQQPKLGQKIKEVGAPGSALESTEEALSNSPVTEYTKFQQWLETQNMQQQPSIQSAHGEVADATTFKTTKDDLSKSQQWQPTQQMQLPIQQEMEQPKSANNGLVNPSETPDTEMRQWGPINEINTQQTSSQITAGGPEVETVDELKNGEVSYLDTGLTTDQPLPPSFENIANFPSKSQTGDIPVLWNIPKAGTSAINDILAGCLQLAIANNVGSQFGHAEDETLQVFQKHGANFLNVDTFSVDGITKAKKLNLASSGMVDAIVVYYIFEASELFSPGRRGKFFTVMRDPIERAVLLVSNKRNDISSASYNPEYATMSLEEIVNSGTLSSNWYVK
mmetsp:Transcript_5044/g.7439  ORF Transcript_5044/g.7439 Transcript_5044/m.7439 type:complete len:660 (-) Transcript_5044:49-2028(-)